MEPFILKDFLKLCVQKDTLTFYDSMKIMSF